MKGPEAVRLELDVDGEGVVRVQECSVEKITMTPDELATLLTGLVKAICGVGDGEETIEVSLN